MAAKNTKMKSQTLVSLASRLDTKKREPPKTEGIKSELVRKLAARTSPAASMEKPRAAVPATRFSSSPIDEKPKTVSSVNRAFPLSGIGFKTPAKTGMPSIPKTKIENVLVPSANLQKAPKKQSTSLRNYPRIGVSVRASLALADNPSSVFQASLPTVNVSVGGLFLESSFFLKLGTKLLVTLELPPDDRTVKAKGEVVRVDSNDKGQTGFAIRFTEYLDGSEVVLATNFLSPVLREFLADYAQVHQFSPDENYLRHVTDVLAAWELKKAKLGDIWAS
jgi:hypothetical protein